MTNSRCFIRALAALCAIEAMGCDSFVSTVDEGDIAFTTEDCDWVDDVFVEADDDHQDDLDKVEVNGQFLWTSVDMCEAQTALRPEIFESLAVEAEALIPFLNCDHVSCESPDCSQAQLVFIEDESHDCGCLDGPFSLRPNRGGIASCGVYAECHCVGEGEPEEVTHPTRPTEDDRFVGCEPGARAAGWYCYRDFLQFLFVEYFFCPELQVKISRDSSPLPLVACEPSVTEADFLGETPPPSRDPP